jgi:AraC-like DNA-binding protein
MEPTNSDFRIEKATHLLHENPSRTVVEVARACSLSNSRLSHLFKAEAGTTVGKLRCRCRFSKARRLLADAPEMAIKGNRLHTWISSYLQFYASL